MYYLIVSVAFLFAGFAAATYLFRRHYKNYHFQIEQRREALRTIMYRTHHHGVNPVCKRIRGISGLGILITKQLPEEKRTVEIIEYFKMIDGIAQELESETLSNIKEFEHLQ
jgi:hypothetical protein